MVDSVFFNQKQLSDLSFSFIFRARDKGITRERPRSWHVSKSLDIEPSYSRAEIMRSPESGYAGNYASRSHHEAMQPSVRRSRGWHESGDLKSVYKPEVTEPKESIYSGSSQRSHRDARLSVSSSKSSGTMSSSRGSMENLVEGGCPQKNDVQSYPQIILSSSTKYKQNSPSQPHAGIVSQQRNMFERLCQDSASGNVSKSDEVARFGKTRRISSDSSDKKDYPNHPREKSWSPMQSDNHSSVSPSSLKKENIFRKRSYDKTGEENGAKTQSSHKNSSSFTKDTTCATSDVLKHVNAKPFKQEQSSYSFVPPPPTRDESSAKAVKNHHRHSQSYSALSSAPIQVCLKHDVIVL